MVRLLSTTMSLALLCSVTVVQAFVVQRRYQTTIRPAAAELTTTTTTTTTTICMAKMKFTIKENLVGSISSDGLFEGRETIERPQSNKLGVSSKLKKKPKSSSSSTNEQQQQPLSKKERQRTGNGNVDSTLSTRIAAPEQETIQVVEAKRGAKSVTIVRGMASPMATRKEILKQLKKSLGTGGTLVEGVLEIQGAYADKAVEVLRKKGYILAQKIGK